MRRNRGEEAVSEVGRKGQVTNYSSEPRISDFKAPSDSYNTKYTGKVAHPLQMQGRRDEIQTDCSLTESVTLPPTFLENSMGAMRDQLKDVKLVSDTTQHQQGKKKGHHSPAEDIEVEMKPCLGGCGKKVNVHSPWGKWGYDAGVCGAACEETALKNIEHDRMTLSSAELTAKYGKRT
ncbi:MAG: hypothetical protein WAV50_00070 [Minisyncoccia bacterium]